MAGTFFVCRTFFRSLLCLTADIACNCSFLAYKMEVVKICDNKIGILWNRNMMEIFIMIGPCWCFALMKCLAYPATFLEKYPICFFLSLVVRQIVHIQPVFSIFD